MAAVPDKQNTSISTSHNDWTKMSVLGRLNYNYKERYYVTFTARYDGASNFAANKKWGFFPSAAVRWNIANEKFPAKGRMDRRTGLARQPRTHRKQTPSRAYPFAGRRGPLDERRCAAAARQQLRCVPVAPAASPDLTWETSDQYTLGADVSLFGSGST